ncbi:S-adenosylmethionine mitochondrial carrier protein isoform X5 [Poeciliopsis prolifica]|uniref:S-adenosylmethionine mitochondrial carrier protein isoform X5 n=1 Tax=Poeciliopsis prolifica TaxID=188132 RepID=UPI002412FA1B|nr:S-adenosylmethionine mitochondrial carrier protein isoform X5 [Poeciliopsis prolifica]
MERRQFVASLVAGGCAGMCVDLTLFPLDTIKTRLQSQQGFHKAGGFKGIYAGVPSAAVGSFPNAAAFFVTYECAKSLLGASGAFAAPRAAPVSHMLAASLGEIVACLIRVPTEVVKQRTQASPSSTTYSMLLATLREEGVRGLYRGYGSTVLREIPFSLVQFPLWEYLKARWQPSSPPLSTWRRPGSCWPRRAQPRRAATSRWCSATCGGAKAFQGCLQAASRGRPSSAREASSSWERTKRSATRYYSGASGRDLPPHGGPSQLGERYQLGSWSVFSRTLHSWWITWKRH